MLAGDTFGITRDILGVVTLIKHRRAIHVVHRASPATGSFL